MPGHVRLTDLCSGHCFPPRLNITSSRDTFINSIPATRYIDVRAIHCCGPLCHGGLNIGVHDVHVNNRYSQAGGDPISCGCFQAQCSPDTFVN